MNQQTWNIKKKYLREVIKYEEPIEKIWAKYERAILEAQEEEGELVKRGDEVRITRAEILNVFHRFLEDKLSSYEIYQWGNVLDARVGYERGYWYFLGGIIEALTREYYEGTPYVTKDMVRDFIRQIETAEMEESDPYDEE